MIMRKGTNEQSIVFVVTVFLVEGLIYPHADDECSWRMTCNGKFPTLMNVACKNWTYEEKPYS